MKRLEAEEDKAAEMAENEKQVHIHPIIGQPLSSVHCELGYWNPLLF